MKIQRFGAPAALALVGALALSACGGQQAEGGSAAQSGRRAPPSAAPSPSDGSSTVGPLTSAAAELFMTENTGVNITVGTSGTGGGFKKFCEGQTQVSNASRPIKDEEKAACEAKGIEYQEIVVANDALTVVANKDNSFLECLTVEELKTLWEPAADRQGHHVEPGQLLVPRRATSSSTARAPTPAPSTTSPTRSTVRRARPAPTTSRPRTTTSSCRVSSGDKNALGYFGYTYFEENADALKAIEVDSGKGCVAPSAETARDGSYAPLSRPLYIYVDKKAYASNAALKAFISFYVENDAEDRRGREVHPAEREQKKTAQDELTALG